LPFFLLSLTLGVGVLVLGDKKLRYKNSAALFGELNASLARNDRHQRLSHPALYVNPSGLDMRYFADARAITSVNARGSRRKTSS